MLIVHVYVHVKTDQVEAFRAASVENAKGEHAFALSKALKEAKGASASQGFTVPNAIAKAIRWASRQPLPAIRKAPANPA